MSLSPKAKLQRSAVAKEVAALLASPNFETASEIAMLTFVNNLSEAPDAQASMMLHQQLVGARRYLSTLANLMTPVQERAAYVPGTLKPVP